MPVRTCASLLLLAVLLAACASRSERIAAELIAYGVPQEPARCVARELDTRLTDEQLATLSKAVGSARKIESTDKPAQAIGEVIDSLNRKDNGELFSITVRAGITCAVLG